MRRNILLGHIIAPDDAKWDDSTRTLSVELVGYSQQESNYIADSKYLQILFERQYFGCIYGRLGDLPQGWMFDKNRMFYGIYFNQENIPVLITYMQMKNNQGTNDAMFSVDFVSPFCYGIRRKDGSIDACNNILRYKEDEYITSQRQRWLKSNRNMLSVNIDMFQKGRKRSIEYKLRIDNDSIIQMKNDCQKQMLIDPKEYTRRFYDFVIKTRRVIDVAGIRSFLANNNIEMMNFKPIR